MPRIVRMHSLGGPEVLRLEEVPATAPGAGEVTIKVGAIGLNRVEAMFRAGGFGTPALPSRIGYEAAGTILAVGAGVTGFQPGDRVATLPGLSMEQYGTYGEEILYRADMLVKLPATQPLEEAAASWMQYLTAYALHAVGGIAQGQAVLITAASSSVGLAAIQIARAAGATPIAVTRGARKRDALRAQGAAHVVVSDDEDIAARVAEITGGRGAALAFDGVAGPAFASLPAAVAPGGCIIIYGAQGSDTASLSASCLMQRGISVRGFAMNVMLADPRHRRDAIAYITAGLETGRLRPVIDRKFALADIAEAHRYLESNAQFGKIVVTV